MERILFDTLVTGLPLIPLFMGIYIVLRIREDFDLTVEGSFALGGAVSAVLLSNGHGPGIALLLGCTAGALAGLGTAMLNLWLHIPVLMAGLVMNLALFTITLRIMGTPTISLLRVDTIFSGVGGPSQTVPVIIVLAVIIAVILGGFALFLRTEIGLSLRASGLNPRMVRSQGVNDNGLMVMALVISNALAAFSGFLIIQVQGYSDINMGTGMFIAGTGAVLLGALFLNPTGSQVLRIILSILLGGLLYRLILVASLRAGLPAGDLKGITALTLIIAVAAQAYVTPAIGRYSSFLKRGTRSRASDDDGTDVSSGRDIVAVPTPPTSPER